MSLPTISKTLIERAKTAVIFAVIVFAIGFSCGIHYSHSATAATQHAVNAAVHQATLKQ